MTDLLELATRCEQATGPHWKLSDEIARAIGWTEHDGGRGSTDWEDAAGRVAQDPIFTDSLDAATALVPEGWATRTDYRPPNIDLPGGFGGPGFALVYQDIGHCYRGDAETAALALCAAALRARAAIATAARQGEDVQQASREAQERGPQGIAKDKLA